MSEFWSRKDAPVHMSDDLLAKLLVGLSWTPTINPSNLRKRDGYSMNQYGETVINSDGAATWAQVMRGWAQIFASGPETLRLYRGYIYLLPGEIDEETIYVHSTGPAPAEPQASDLPPQAHLHHLLVKRDPFVADLQTLADWGDKAATGKYFVLHIGI